MNFKLKTREWQRKKLTIIPDAGIQHLSPVLKKSWVEAYVALSLSAALPKISYWSIFYFLRKRASSGLALQVNEQKFVLGTGLRG
jgi:hypothetical protein